MPCIMQSWDEFIMWVRAEHATHCSEIIHFKIYAPPAEWLKAQLNVPWVLPKYVITQRVGIFNFRVYRVWVLLKTLGSCRVSGIFAKKISIGYFRVLKILIGYFRVHPNIAHHLVHFKPFLAILDHLKHFGPFRTIMDHLDHFGPLWTIWNPLDILIHPNTS